MNDNQVNRKILFITGKILGGMQKILSKTMDLFRKQDVNTMDL